MRGIESNREEGRKSSRVVSREKRTKIEREEEIEACCCKLRGWY